MCHTFFFFLKTSLNESKFFGLDYSLANRDPLFILRRLVTSRRHEAIISKQVLDHGRGVTLSSARTGDSYFNCPSVKCNTHLHR